MGKIVNELKAKKLNRSQKNKYKFRPFWYYIVMLWGENNKKKRGKVYFLKLTRESDVFFRTMIMLFSITYMSNILAIR